MKFLLYLLFFTPLSLFAQKNNMNISANIIAGCSIQAEDVNFGIMVRNSSKTIFSKIYIHCPKNVNLSLNIQGNNYANQGLLISYPRMKHSKGKGFLSYKMTLKNTNSQKLSLTSGVNNINSSTLLLGSLLSQASLKTLVSQKTEVELLSTIDIPLNQEVGDYLDYATIIVNY